MLDEHRVSERGHLLIGGYDAVELAHRYGTPLHVLDEGRVRTNCRAYVKALRADYPGESRPIYASKALCVMGVVRLAHDEGLDVDVASAGEIHTAVRAGVPAASLHLHGNNKTPEDLRFALRRGVGRVIADTLEELELLRDLAAEAGAIADVLLRLTPGIEPNTHRAIQTGGVDSKFGFAMRDGAAREAVRVALDTPGIRLRGIHCHVGSQVLEMEPFVGAAEAMVEFAGWMREAGAPVEELNLGGGLGIRYVSEHRPPAIEAYVAALARTVVERCRERHLALPRLFVEPGRSIVGDAGVTLYTVGPTKAIPGIRTYVNVDGGMWENPRPALYGAVYEAVVADRAAEPPTGEYAVAGRCCESGDVLIWQARLAAPRSGEILAMFSTGAYTYSMASNYNRFPRPAVVGVEGGRARVLVERETYDDLIRKDVPPAS